MFDSFGGVCTSICLLVIILAWFISGLPRWMPKIILAFVTPVLVSFGWCYLPTITLWFKPLAFGQDDWGPWVLMGAIMCSAVSVPLSMIAVLALSFWRKRRGIGNLDSSNAATNI